MTGRPFRRSNGLFQLWNKYEQRLRPEFLAEKLLSTGDRLYQAKVTTQKARSLCYNYRISVTGVQAGFSSLLWAVSSETREEYSDGGGGGRWLDSQLLPAVIKYRNSHSCSECTIMEMVCSGNTFLPL